MLSCFALPESAKRIYVALIDRDAQGISEIARVSGQYRPAVYRGIKALERHGLVRTAKFGKRTRYEFVSVRELEHMFRLHTQMTISKEEQRDVMYRKEDISSRIFKTTFVSGDQSVKVVFDDVITSSKRGDTFYRITSEQDVSAVNALLPTSYRRRRDAKHLERKVISNSLSSSTKRKRLERFIRTIDNPEDTFMHNIIELVYGNKVAYLDISSKEAMIIEHKTLAEFHRSVFRALYQRL